MNALSVKALKEPKGVNSQGSDKINFENKPCIH